MKGEGRGRGLRKILVRILLVIAMWYLVFPPFVLPVSGRISSKFFFRFSPDGRFPWIEFHSGTDYAAAEGSTVSASKGGFVRSSGQSPGYGNFVELTHWLGFSTLYAHLASILAKEGSYVPKGFPLGKVGSTGRATGPHLHFEIRFRGRALPPGAFLLVDIGRRFLVSSLGDLFFK